MNTTKKILIGITFLFLTLGFMVYRGLYLMAIEDRYGDLQNVYFDSQSGDILVNNINKKSGEILLENNRVYVIQNDKKFDLEEWLDPNSKMKFNLDVYGKDSKSNTKLHLEFEY